MSVEIPRLNTSGQVLQAAVASFGINGLVHPLVTAKNLHFAGLPVTRSGLYNGFLAICAVDLISNSALYMTNDALKDTSSLGSSIIAGIGSSLVLAPGEALMANRQVHALPYSQILTRALRPAGLTSTILREIPYAGAVFCLSPIIQKKMEKHFVDATSSSSVVDFGIPTAAGVVSGTLAGFATTPFDLIKTRVQTSERPISIWTAGREVVVKNGWKGLMEGSGPRALSIALMVGGMSVVNNHVPKCLPESMRSKQD